MSNNTNPKNLHGKIIYYILLAVIIILHLAYVTYLFVCVKQGSHPDEVWSYGAANSRHRPFLFLNEGVPYYGDVDILAENTSNYREWVPGDVLRDFLVVNEGEQFDYESVYYNQALDYHPPFYYIILHTICSFFPGVYSPWFSYSINIISLIFTQIFLFGTVSLICRSEKTGLAACLFYALCYGSHLTFIYLRQYSLLPMLFMLYIYLNTKLFACRETGKDPDLKKYMPGIAVTSFLIFYTNYPSIMFVGAFTACFCVYFIAVKKIKQMFIYGLSETAALALLFAAFPAVINQLGTHNFGADSGYDYDFSTILKLYMNQLLGNTAGFTMSFWKSAEIRYIPVLVFAAIFIILPLAYLFRKEKWFIKLVTGTAESLAKSADDIGKSNKIPLFSVISSFALLLTYIGTVNIFKMGATVSRYLFMLYPIACMLIVCILDVIAAKLFSSAAFRTTAVSAAVIFMGLCSDINLEKNANYDRAFQITNGYFYTDISETVRDENCIAVLSYDNSHTWVMTAYTAYLRNADSVFFTSVLNSEQDFGSIAASDKYVRYVLLPQYCISVSDAQYMDIQSEMSSMDQNVIVSGESTDDTEEYLPLDDTLRTLNGGCTFDIRSTLNIQGESYYLLELSRNAP